MDTSPPLVVLAAGRGSRLGIATDIRPKPLVELAGRPLLHRLLDAASTARLGPVSVVVGYRGDLIAAAAPAARTIPNPGWATTSIAASLLAAADAGALAAGAVIAYGDIVVEPRILAALRDEPPGPVTIPVNTSWRELWAERMPDPLADAERLVLDGASVRAIGGRPETYDEVHAQFMGLIRVSAAGARDLAGFYRHAAAGSAAARRWDITALLDAYLTAGGHLAALQVSAGWLEVDTPADLGLYERLHATGRLAALCAL